MNRRAGAFALCVSLLGAATAHAAEYRSVGVVAAILYNAPTERARKVFLAPRGMPVELILNQDGWSKIRDASGDLSWVQSRDLVTRRTVVVTAASAPILANASDAAPALASADKGVLFEMKAAAPAGWVNVMHEDGTAGYIKAGDVWGD